MQRTPLCPGRQGRGPDQSRARPARRRRPRADQSDPLERVLRDFESEYFYAARTQAPEGLARIAAQRTALIEQARTRFPEVEIVVKGCDEV
ncbi:hypothetical protein ABZS96_26120 [Streptomyces avermitilis]|uniref:hypothetical protein n=1 Tax=Streptomyces avermitilis TaxID=33903 RepID=UPI0033B02F5A